MRKFCLTLGFMFALATSSPAATYTFNPGHTEVRFFWSHAGVSEQSGEWGSVQGTVEFDPDELESTQVSVTIQADSVNTGFGPLDDDLRSERFFDVANHPEISFVSAKTTQTGPKSVQVTGDLTIKGITHPLTLDVELVHFGEHPLAPFMASFAGTWLGVHASGTLIRSNYGLGFGAPINSDLIRIEISTEMQPN